MADFNAGSIEGSLDLETSPFVHGLQLAKLQAEQFEAKPITKTVTTRYETSGDQPGAGDGAEVKADDTQFHDSLAKDEAELKAFGTQKTTAKVDVDTNKASAAITALQKHVDNLSGVFHRNTSPGSGGGSGHGLLMLVGLASALAPAFGPAVPAVALFGAAAVAAFGGAAVSLALYGVLAKGAFSQIQAAIKAGQQLPGMAGLAETAFKGLTSAWSALQKSVDTGIFGVMTRFFGLLAGVLPKLVPLVNSISKGLEGAFEPFKHLLDGGQFQAFIGLLSSNAVKDLPKLGHIVSNTFSGLMGVFTALNPVIQVGLNFIEHMSLEFSKWSKWHAPAFVEQIFGTVKKEGPGFLRMLGAILSGIGHIVAGFGPLVKPATSFLTTLGNALKLINLGPLAKGVGNVLVALEPFLTVLGTLINILLPPLGVLLSTLATDFIDPLGKSLLTGLTPAFQALADVLDYAAPFLGRFLSSIANLVNPTGVSLLNKLITTLTPIVKKLIPPVTDLLVALEGMVDQFLNKIGPAIGPAGAHLSKFADYLSPLIEELAVFVGKHGTAIIVGVVGVALAFKGFFAAARALKAFNEVAILTGPLIDLMLGPVGLAIIAIAVLAGGFYYAYTHSKKFRDEVGKFTDWLKGPGLTDLHAFGDYFINTMLPGIENFGKNIGHSLLPVLKQLRDTFKGMSPDLQKLHDHFEKWKPMLELIGRFVVKAIELQVALDSKVLVAFIKVYGFVMKYWIPILLTFFDVFVEWIGLIVKGIETLGGAVLDVAKFLRKMADTYGKVKADIVAWFKDAGGWLLDKGEAILKGLFKGIKNGWADPETWFKAMASRIRGFFGDAGSWLLDKGTAVLHGLLSGVTGFWKSDALPWFKGIDGNIVDAVGELGATLTAAGLSVITGLLQGMQAEWTVALAWLKAAMGALPSLAKKVLEHGSPSKVFMRIGRDNMVGLHLGMANYFAKTLMPWMTHAMGTLSNVKVTTPKLAMAGSPAQKQIAAITDLTAQFQDAMAGVVKALRDEGTESRAHAAGTAGDLLDSLDSLGNKVATSNGKAIAAAIVQLRKG